MKPKGKAHILARINDATTLEELAKRWSGFGKTYQRDPEIVAAKDQRKDQLARREVNWGAG